MRLMKRILRSANPGQSKHIDYIVLNHCYQFMSLFIRVAGCMLLN